MVSGFLCIRIDKRLLTRLGLGSSCVYFKAMDHPQIRAYIDKLVKALPSNVSGQLAFDFIETENPHRLVAIECNPRATSGIHLYSGTPMLANALTCHCSSSSTCSSDIAVAKPGARRQLAPGMLMWKRTKSDRNAKTALKQYLRHMMRLVSSKDVIFSVKDIMPSLMQPFLLTSYYEICREKHLKLPTMFQWDLTWEPKGDDLRAIRRKMEEAEDIERKMDGNTMKGRKDE